MKHIGRTKIVQILTLTDFGIEVNVKGWVRTKRGNKQVLFIALNDGSCIHNLQIVVEPDKFDEHLLKRITVITSYSIHYTKLYE